MNEKKTINAEKIDKEEKTIKAEKVANGEKTIKAEKAANGEKTIKAEKAANGEKTVKVEKTTIAEQLKAGNTVVSFMKGNSMHPLLYEGKTYVVIAPITRDLSIGDMPLFQRPDGKYVLHRLIKMENGFCYTRGDNCIGTEKVPNEKILGVVTEIVRGGKTIRVTDRIYRRYVTFWLKLAPVRIPLYKLRAKWNSLKHRLRRGMRESEH